MCPYYSLLYMQCAHCDKDRTRSSDHNRGRRGTLHITIVMKAGDCVTIGSVLSEGHDLSHVYRASCAPAGRHGRLRGQWAPSGPRRACAYKAVDNTDN